MIIDAKSEEILKLIYPSVADRWRLCADAMDERHNIQIRLTEGLRTIATQTQYWAKGRSKNSDGHWYVSNPKLVVTHAAPGQSLHGFGLALDICVVGPVPFPTDHSIWKKYGDILKEFGLTWGGDWKGAECDQPHCEDKFGYTLKEIQSFYLKHNNLKDVWDMCDLKLMPGMEKK